MKTHSHKMISLLLSLVLVSGMDAWGIGDISGSNGAEGVSEDKNPAEEGQCVFAGLFDPGAQDVRDEVKKVLKEISVRKKEGVKEASKRTFSYVPLEGLYRLSEHTSVTGEEADLRKVGLRLGSSQAFEINMGCVGDKGDMKRGVAAGNKDGVFYDGTLYTLGKNIMVVNSLRLDREDRLRPSEEATSTLSQGVRLVFDSMPWFRKWEFYMDAAKKYSYTKTLLGYTRKCGARFTRTLRHFNISAAYEKKFVNDLSLESGKKESDALSFFADGDLAVMGKSLKWKVGEKISGAGAVRTTNHILALSVLLAEDLEAAVSCGRDSYYDIDELSRDEKYSASVSISYKF